MENDLSNYFLLLSEQENPPVIELQNCNHEPVGALYLDKFRVKGQLAVSQGTGNEKYLLYCDGIAVFFSYFKKVINKK